MQQRRVGSSALQKVPAVWHWKGAEILQGPPWFEHTPEVLQQPPQHDALLVHMAFSAMHAVPASRSG